MFVSGAVLNIGFCDIRGRGRQLLLLSCGVAGVTICGLLLRVAGRMYYALPICSGKRLTGIIGI